jgi:uncharacterized protein YndB with AHSA1/START domain
MSTDTAVHLTRTFDAAREVVWRMWTDPKEFAAWYGPDGATVDVREMDVRPGGRRVVAMHVETPQGAMTMEFSGEYREVQAPERLVYTEAVAAHPETVVEVELREDSGGTTVLLTHHGIPAGSPGEMGWTMALDHLQALLTDA